MTYKNEETIQLTYWRIARACITSAMVASLFASFSSPFVINPSLFLKCKKRLEYFDRCYKVRTKCKKIDGICLSGRVHIDCNMFTVARPVRTPGQQGLIDM